MQIDLDKQQNLTAKSIDKGVMGFYALDNDDACNRSIVLSQNEMIWVCSSSEVEINSEALNNSYLLQNSESVLLTHPPSEWNINIRSKQGEFCFFIISLQALHELLSADFNEDNMDYAIDYSQISKVVSLSPKIMNSLAVIFSRSKKSPFHHIEKKGNFLLAFSIMMEKLFGNREHACPFQMNRATEEKIRFVRNNIVNNLSDQPDVLKLSFEVNIPKTILKQGFQHVYGKSIHNFYHDYRMDKAISLLENGQHLVKEIAFEIGYQNPSHFIAAFKKRNGCTPKQYMKNY